MRRKKTLILIMVITVISQTLGFFRDMTLSYFFGATDISDAYIVATAIPMSVFTFIGTSISTGFIPVLNKVEEKEGIDGANQFTNNLINNLLLICIGIVGIGIIGAKPISFLFASGVERDTLALITNLSRITWISIIFATSTFIFTGYLQHKGKFVFPAAVGIPMNIGIIVSIVLAAGLHKTVILAIGYVLSMALQFLLLLPGVWHCQYKYEWRLDRKDPYLREMLINALPIIVGLSVNPINAMVDKTVASWISKGAISSLTYSYRINTVINYIAVVSLGTILFPQMIKLAQNENIKELKEKISKAIKFVVLIITPSSIGLMLVADPIIKMLFGRGAFDQAGIHMTVTALMFYSVGMLALGVREILSRTFFAFQDTKTPMINSFIALICNIILNIILSKYLGVGGIALATSIAAIISVILLWVSLKKKIGSISFKEDKKDLIKILISAAIMGVIVYSANKLLLQMEWNSNWSVLILVGIGSIVYGMLLALLRVREMEEVKSHIKKLLKQC